MKMSANKFWFLKIRIYTFYSPPQGLEQQGNHIE